MAGDVLRVPVKLPKKIVRNWPALVADDHVRFIPACVSVIVEYIIDY